MEKKDFWTKVGDCKHENLTDHYENVFCSTEYCSGDESHCADCGVFIQECSCHYNDGMSGWPQARYKSLKN